MGKSRTKRKLNTDAGEEIEEKVDIATVASSSRPQFSSKVSTAATMMQTEKHPWLKWPGCDRNQKIEFNNRLAALQFRGICPPRFMDFALCNRLNVKEKLNDLLRTRNDDICEEMDVKMWQRALNVSEQVYREWCLEFYSTLSVEKKRFKDVEFGYKKLIYFRLGGQDYNLTVIEFGVLTGIFMKEETRHPNFMRFFTRGVSDSKNFGVHEAWAALTGLPKHMGTSKTSSLRSPLLRLVHKLLTRSFVQRSTQTDKVYTEDLWLLHTFHTGGPSHYVCVPWILVCFMESRGAGRQHDSQICCGHFITRIAKNLKLATQANIRLCSAPVDFRYITIQELDTSKLLNKTRTALVDEIVPAGGGEVPEAEGEDLGTSRGKQRATNNDLMQQMKGITSMMRRMGRDVGHRLNKIEGKLDSSMAYQNYHIQRYQPLWESMAVSQAASSGTEWPSYAPPPFYVPEELEEEEAEEEEESNDNEEGEAEEEG